MPRLIAIVVPLAVATFSVSRRLSPRPWVDAAVAAAPLVGLAAGLGIERIVDDGADIIAAVDLAVAGAFLLAGEGTWMAIAAAMGLGIGLLGPPPVAAVIMVGVQAVAASALGLLAGGRLGPTLRRYGEQLAGLAVAAIGIYLFFDRLAT